MDQEPRDGSVWTTSLARPEGEVVTIQELHVAPGREEEFVARFESLDVLRLAADAADELLEATMLQDDSRFLVVTRWVSAAGIDAWIASPSRELVRGELEPLYARPPTVTRHSIRSRHISDDREGSS